MARVPTGSGMIWYTATAPDGWVLCDGSAVGRVGANAGVFALLGTTYGVGDGSTTFNLPDLRQRFPLGKAAAGTGSTLAGTGGAIDHVHTVDPPSTTSGVPSDQTTVCVATPTVNVGSRIHTHDVDVASFNSGAANPPFLVVNFIIKQ
jgi:microcystin-dependent protein